MSESNRSLADQYGDVKARITELEEQAKELRQQILDSGETKLVGDDWRVSISSGTRETLDLKVVRKFLTREQLDLANRTTSFDLVRVKPVAKNAEDDE